MAVAVVGFPTGGCLPTALMAASSLIGGPTTMAGSTSKAPYAGRGATAQNGHEDPTVAQALRASDAEVTEECLQRKQALRTSGPTGVSQEGDAEAGPVCAIRPACLPGLTKPVLMHVCKAQPQAPENAAPAS